MSSTPPRHRGAFSHEDAAVVCGALASLREDPTDDADGLAAVGLLLADARVHFEMHPSGPTYQAVCEAAIEALVACGVAALPILANAQRSTHTVTVPEPCYDQGVYIGDYSSRTIVVAQAAADAVRRIGAQHAGSVAWVGMTREAWLVCSDAVTLLRAVFEENQTRLADHVRRFIAVCCREGGDETRAVDQELEAALALAERVAFTEVTRDHLTAARAAARHSVAALALAANVGLAEALAALERLRTLPAFERSPELLTTRLHELVPYRANSALAPPPPAPPAPWDELLDAVVANLDDDAPRLAFAAWLAERGDAARAELITAQCEIARARPATDEERARFDVLRARERALAQHTATWTRWPAAVVFERGFANRAFRNGSSDEGTLPALRGEPTLREITIFGMPGGGWLDALARAPEAAKLTRLVIDGGRFYPFELAPLFRSPRFERLRVLEMPGCGIDPTTFEDLLAWSGLQHAVRIVLTRNDLPADARERLTSTWPDLREIVT